MKTRQKDSEIAALASGLNRTNSFGMGSGAFNLDRQDSYTMSLAPYQEAEKEKEGLFSTDIFLCVYVSLVLPSTSCWVFS